MSGHKDGSKASAGYRITDEVAEAMMEIISYLPDTEARLLGFLNLPMTSGWATLKPSEKGSARTKAA